MFLITLCENIEIQTCTQVFRHFCSLKPGCADWLTIFFIKIQYERKSILCLGTNKELIGYFFILMQIIIENKYWQKEKLLDFHNDNNAIQIVNNNIYSDQSFCKWSHSRNTQKCILVTDNSDQHQNYRDRKECNF